MHVVRTLRQALLLIGGCLLAALAAAGIWSSRLSWP
jgi:hypothetical protein